MRSDPWRLALVVITCVLASLGAMGCGGDDGTGVLVHNAKPIFGAKPGATFFFTIPIKNTGDGDLSLASFSLVEEPPESVGKFTVTASLPTTLVAGRAIGLPATFEFGEGVQGGCGFQARAVMRLTYIAGGLTRSLQVPLELWGECAQTIQCTAETVDFGEVILGEQGAQPPTRTFGCVNSGPTPVDITEIGASGEGEASGTFVIDTDDVPLPKKLGSGESVFWTATFDPGFAGTFESAAIIKTTGDPAEAVVPLRGVATPIIPSCNEPLEDVPMPVTEIGQYQLEMGQELEIRAEGALIESDMVGSSSTPRIIERALLLGTGGFLHEGCIVGNTGASFSWSGAACQQDGSTLYNALVVPASERVTKQLKALPDGINIRVEGYKINRFTDFSPGGGWWEDGGGSPEAGEQISLYTTRICEVMGIIG